MYKGAKGIQQRQQQVDHHRQDGNTQQPVIVTSISNEQGKRRKINSVSMIMNQDWNMMIQN